MSARASPSTAATERQRVLLAGLAAAAVTVAFDRTGFDVVALGRDALAAATPWAGVARTLTFGVGLAALPVATAWLAHHPALCRPLRQPGNTRVSGMQSFWRLLTAYWMSERWLEAWTLTAAVIAITTLISMSSVWVATATANFLSAIVSFHGPQDGADPVAILVTSVAIFAAVNLGRFAVTGVRHFVSNTLHRKARRWTQAQFSAALLGHRHVAMTLMSDRAAGANGALPDNIDQRIDECSNAMYAGLIGLSMGVWGAITSITFVSVAIIERSVEVPFLERWFASFAAAAGDLLGERVGAALAVSPGEYGSALLVALLIVVYVPLSTLGAWLIGRVLERQTLERQNREATWRGELNHTLVRSNQIAISGGQRVQERTNARLYRHIDDVWHRMNLTQASIMVFNDSYSFLSRRLVSYLPALPAYVAGTLSFRRYSATSELAAQLIDDCSWFITVMPAIVTLRAHTRRLSEVARAIEAANDQERFHRQSGVHEFRHLTQDTGFGLTLRGVKLYHRGHDVEPFALVPRINLRPGQWAYVRGANGCGKSSLLKAIAGIWPYGSGDIIRPEGARLFFAGQDTDLPMRLSLKELVTYPEFPERYTDPEVAYVLAEVGLGKFIRELDEPLHHGKPWNDIFSGGQRQRLVLARILMQQPDIILLDEACAALDPTGTTEFHRLLKEHCAEAIVLSVMHMPEPPAGPHGRPFYDRILYFNDRLVDLHPARGAPVPVAAE